MNNTDVSFFFYHFTICIAPQLLLKSTFNSSKISGSFSSLFNFQGSIKLSLFRNSSPILSHYSPSCQGFSLTFLRFFRDRFRLFSLSPLGNSVVILSPIFPVVNPFSPFFWPFLRFCTPARVCLGCRVVLGTIFSYLLLSIHALITGRLSSDASKVSASYSSSLRQEKLLVPL